MFSFAIGNFSYVAANRSLLEDAGALPLVARVLQAHLRDDSVLEWCHHAVKTMGAGLKNRAALADSQVYDKFLRAAEMALLADRGRGGGSEGVRKILADLGAGLLGSPAVSRLQVVLRIFI